MSNNQNEIKKFYKKNFTKTIINNIKDKKEDWLEIKDEITKEIYSIMSNKKEEIIKEFYDSSINEKLNINDIIILIFVKDYSKLYSSNMAFTKVFSILIDDMIKQENLNIEFSKYDDVKDDINKAYKKIESMEKYEDSLK